MGTEQGGDLPALRRLTGRDSVAAGVGRWPAVLGCEWRENAKESA